MVQENKPNSDSGSKDPYNLLGIEPGATFEVIKKAKEKKISEAGLDQIKKAKIEAAYDCLLMVSLKARQQGTISNEAANASQQEKINNKEVGGIANSLLTRIRKGDPRKNEPSTNGVFSGLNFPGNEGLTVRVSLAILVVVLILISPDQSIELLLALSTIGVFISQLKRGRKPLPSLGWSVVLLSVGLILGGLVSNSTGIHPENLSGITTQKIEALPAVFLLFIGSLVLE